MCLTDVLCLPAWNVSNTPSFFNVLALLRVINLPISELTYSKSFLFIMARTLSYRDACYDIHLNDGIKCQMVL